MALSKNAKKAKKLALQKIKNNIENIYGDELAEFIISEARQCFVISDKFYNESKEEIFDMTSIHKILMFLIDRWANQTYQDEKITNVVNKSVEVFNVKLEIQDSKQAKKIIKKLKGIKGTQYLKHVVTNYINGGSMIYPTMNINPKIWKSIVGAMLFGIPKEEILKRKQYILGEYLPKVNNSLQIQINELTTLGEFEIIKDEIKKKQKEYEKRNKYWNKKREYEKRETDKEISDLFNQNLTKNELKKKLKETIKGYAERLVRFNEYKKQTRKKGVNKELKDRLKK